MRKVSAWMTMLAVAGLASLALAAELKSGLPSGTSVGAFEVVKVGGAVNDGVDVGEQLCYRCRYGNRPAVMVFARTADEHLAALTKKLDAALAAHESQKLSAFVNLIGGEQAKLEADAKKLATSSKAERVAVVVPVDTQDGPPSYEISPQADVTVLVYKAGKVQTNYALGKGGLTDDVIASILADAEKLLN